ncbi:hypothetical protein D3C72_1951710 [compost metagenome]
MGVTADHLAHHPSRHAVAPMLRVNGHVRHAASVRIVLDRQVQQKTDDRVGLVRIGGDNQLHVDPFRPVQRFQVQMNLIADRILVHVVQQVAWRDRDHADVSQVIDHHLQNLAVDVLGARCLEVADLGHCGD